MGEDLQARRAALSGSCVRGGDRKPLPVYERAAGTAWSTSAPNGPRARRRAGFPLGEDRGQPARLSRAEISQRPALDGRPYFYI